MAGDMFTKCFGNSQKLYEVMKPISHMPWSDFLKLFNQGNKPYPQDVKKEITKTEVKKEEVVLTLENDTTTKKGWPNQMADIKDTTKKKKRRLSRSVKRGH